MSRHIPDYLSAAALSLSCDAHTLGVVVAHHAVSHLLHLYGISFQALLDGVPPTGI